MRIAIVGAGGIGKTHIQNLRAIPAAEITDICDVSAGAKEIADQLEAAYHIDCGQMMVQTKAEVVLICTPTFLHVGQVRAVLQAGKHCICEKPLCLHADEARELFALAKRQGVRLFVAHVLHFWQEYGLLSRLVREETYGRALDVTLLRLTERPAWISGGWLFDRQRSGLLPFDLHIHDLYYLVSLFGKPKIACLQSGGRREADYAEYLRVYYEYPDVTVCAEASWYNAPIPFTQSFRVYFERALVEFDGKRMIVYEQGAPNRILHCEESREAIGTSVNVTPTAAYLHELEHFLDCIRCGSASEIVPEQQVIESIEVLEAIAAMSDKGEAATSR